MLATDPFLLADAIAGKPDPFLLADVITSKPTANWWGGRAQAWTGEKFPFGLGASSDIFADYWELRRHSAEMFQKNLYARGVIRRLITNEINTGLMLEAEPNDILLDNLTAEEAAEWTENVESRFELWGANPKLCDYEERRTWAELQNDARSESLIEGDVLIVLRQNRRLGLPQVQIVRGGRVRTPTKLQGNRRIIQGVEVDDRGRHKGFWVHGTARDEGTFIPANGERTGRKLAWLMYGTDKRMEQVRGMPLLGIVLQSIKEIDRYRDYEQRAAAINAMLAMWIEKGENMPGTLPMSGGAMKNIRATGTGFDGEAREFNAAGQQPGMVIEELQVGEKPHSFTTSRPNVNFGAFESAVIHAIAWANEIPPEILTLEFQNNYSASKAAMGEFRAYITKIRSLVAANFCQPIYVEWLVGEVLAGRIAAEGFLEARRDPTQYDVFGAWVRSDWGGPVKPSLELKKDVQAYAEAIDLKITTRDRASKDIFGTRFDRTIKRWAKEQRLVSELDEEFGLNPEPVVPPAPGAVPPVDPTVAKLDNVIELVQEVLDVNA